MKKPRLAALQIVVWFLAALALIGCDRSETRSAAGDDHTPAAPVIEGTGGGGGEATCLRCNDALAHGAHGAFCPEADQLITDLDVCNDNHCLDACDDDAFHGLATPETEAACLSCLEAHCSAEVKACAADRAGQ